MRRFSQNWATGHIPMMANNVRRRYQWFLGDASAGQFANLASAAAAFGAGRVILRSLPVLVKVDLSPVCNLHCTYCVHARPSGHVADILAEQRFSSRQRMPVEQFSGLVDQLAGRTSAVALYYLGDPLVHPQLTDMCRIASEAGLNSHVSTNFSFRLGPDRLRSLVTDGPTHLTVCLDSLTQELYGRTRVGGDVNLVLGNLERLLRLRQEEGRTFPRVEVQFLKYQHNLHEMEETARWCAARGVDMLTDYWGNLHNYADLAPGLVALQRERRRSVVPRCTWPWFAMVVRYDGAAIPCCYHRVSEQHRAGGDDRPVGNVFADGVGEVWNSPTYQSIRRLARRPRRAWRDPSLRGTFCDGCGALYDIEPAPGLKTGKEWRWEDVYFRDPSGAVVRR